MPPPTPLSLLPLCHLAPCSPLSPTLPLFTLSRLPLLPFLCNTYPFPHPPNFVIYQSPCSPLCFLSLFSSFSCPLSCPFAPAVLTVRVSAMTCSWGHKKVWRVKNDSDHILSSVHVVNVGTVQIPWGPSPQYEIRQENLDVISSSCCSILWAMIFMFTGYVSQSFQGLPSWMGHHQVRKTARGRTAKAVS